MGANNAMTHIPLSDDNRAKLREAQEASLANDDELLAGTNLPTSEYGWLVLDGVVVRDDSGKEQKILNGN